MNGAEIGDAAGGPNSPARAHDVRRSPKLRGSPFTSVGLANILRD
jgi:hypothetical protein